VATGQEAGPELDPGRVAVGQAPLWFAIGEAGQTAQVPPIDAGGISPVSTGQVAADSRRHGGLQRDGADPNPCLPATGAAVEYHTGFVPAAPHGFPHRRLGMIQVDQDIARVAVSGKGLQINIASLPVADTQEAHRSGLGNLLGGPHAFPGKCPTGGVMDEANQVKFAGHGAQLPPNSLHGDKQSVIDHRAVLPSASRPDGRLSNVYNPAMIRMHPWDQGRKIFAVNSGCCISGVSQKRAQSMRSLQITTIVYTLSNCTGRTEFSKCKKNTCSSALQRSL